MPYDAAFSGFSDDIVIIVGSALLVSAGVARSGIMELAIQRYAPNVTGVRAQLILLVTVVTVLSAFVKNIGALAIMIPIAFQFARRSGSSPSVFLMPMAFGSLLGGLMTQIGTSPNIVVSRVREEITGTAFTMFDFTPVGAALAAAGIVFLALFYWLVPVRTREAGSIHEALDIQRLCHRGACRRRVGGQRQDRSGSPEICWRRGGGDLDPAFARAATSRRCPTRCCAKGTSC